MIVILFTLPFALLCYACYGLSQMKEKDKRHMISLGLAFASMMLCLLLAGAAMKDEGILQQLFHTGTPAMLTAAGLMILLPIAALCSAVAPVLPGNGRWDRSLRVTAFFSTGGWCVLAFLAAVVSGRC